MPSRKNKKLPEVPPQNGQTGPAEATGKLVHVIRERSPNALVYYSNDSTIQHSQWEIQMNFGHVLAPLDPNADHVKSIQDIVIVMTLGHAQAFARALVEHIAKTKADWLNLPADIKAMKERMGKAED